MNLVLQHAKIVSFIVGALSILSFAPHYFILSSFVGFSVLVFLLIKAETAKQAFARGYWFGFAHFAFGLSWVGNALLIEPEKFGWLYPVTLLAAGGFFGLFFAFPALVSFYAKRNWQKWLSFSAAVVVFEWLRSFFLTGFPWNLQGYSLAFNQELIQAAALGGVYLLSLAAVLSYSILGLWLVSPRNESFIWATVFILMAALVLWGGGYYRLNNAEMVETDTLVRIVQPSIPQKMKWNRQTLEENFAEYIRLSGQKGKAKPNLIVWGETASPFMLDVDEEHMQQVLPVIPQHGYLVTGMISYQPANGRYLPHNSMAVINENGQVAAYYHKSHLVPFGEYIPLREYLPSFIRPVANVIGAFGKGNGPETIKLSGLPSFGGVICYEVIFPHEIVDGDNRPDFLINLTNDGWYGNSAGPYQHWVAAKMRAVEEGVVVLRAANNGISGLINAYGKEKALLPLNKAGNLDVYLDKSPEKLTPYSRYGNSIIITFCLILLFLGFIKVAR